MGRVRTHVESPKAAARKIENLESLLRGPRAVRRTPHTGEGVSGYLARLSLDSRDEEPGEDQATPSR